MLLIDVSLTNMVGTGDRFIIHVSLKHDVRDRSSFLVHGRTTQLHMKDIPESNKKKLCVDSLLIYFEGMIYLFIYLYFS